MKGMNKQLFLEILERYNSGKASEEEVAYLEAYYNLFELNPDFLTEDNEDKIKDAIKLKIDRKIALHESNKGQEPLEGGRTFKMSFQRYAAAAVVFIALFAGMYFILKKESNSAVKYAVHQDHSPGSNKAILTLSNGKKIVLDNAVNGEIAKQPGISIANSPDGQIVYTVTADKGEETIGATTPSNTIATPKGGQYQVVLSDGTRVWLNSASSITYPSAFTSQERLVELNGEAYFEVAKNKKVPFRVKTATQTVEVLGTHFNINSYIDEPVTKTTLLEGAVKVSAGNAQAVLSPGQQAKVAYGSTHINVDKEINIDKVMAWKNGVFSFENDDLKSIMRQISRWYDVDVVYTGTVSDEKFFGEISRNSNLSEVFKILELNNVHFNISGKTVRVISRP